MSPWRRPRGYRGAALLIAVPWVCGAAACGSQAGGEPVVAEAGIPRVVAELEALIVTEVPSGLPRLADDAVHPPAGAKSVDDVAGYSTDPVRERRVLDGYGYRHGWERFWGTGIGAGPITGVFVDQFDDPAGADVYAEDLARNDAERYRGVLRENPPNLPDDCRLLTVESPGPDSELGGPAALTWCRHGPFSVSVSVVADDADAAEAEVRAVLAEQLDRLPPE